ncbi:HipA domain-containing protein [Krasilnikovia cinnamomea]|uniref:HipA domain-containing protein n=1 Tax=Krasilnikovia cinnamomea TaxID=349313 RepID=UPI001A910E19
MIAKFPHHADDWSVIAWEKTALDLAEAAGIPVPKRQLVGVEGNPVLLLERFDRKGAHRIGYLSAVTLPPRTADRLGRDRTVRCARG